MSLRTTLIVRGLLAIAIGIVSVAWPGITIGAFVILFAIFAFVVAFADASRAFDSERVGPIVGYLLLSLLSVAAGVLSLLWPGPTALALVVLIGIWAFVGGAFEVALTFRGGETVGRRAMWLLGGLFTIALGVVLFIRPYIGAESLAMVFGLYCVVVGIGALVVSTEAGPLHREVERIFSSSSSA
jgi:uncharacterized membrane protein HdeD (DUF308 family)